VLVNLVRLFPLLFSATFVCAVPAVIADDLSTLKYHSSSHAFIGTTPVVFDSTNELELIESPNPTVVGSSYHFDAEQAQRRKENSRKSFKKWASIALAAGLIARHLKYRSEQSSAQLTPMTLASNNSVVVGVRLSFRY